MYCGVMELYSLHTVCVLHSRSSPGNLFDRLLVTKFSLDPAVCLLCSMLIKKSLKNHVKWIFFHTRKHTIKGAFSTMIVCFPMEGKCALKGLVGVIIESVPSADHPYQQDNQDDENDRCRYSTGNVCKFGSFGTLGASERSLAST